MSSKQAKTIIYFIFTSCLTLGLSISLQSLLAAWAPPTQPPVSGNVPSPIYSYSTVTQTITGTGGHLMLGGNDFGAWNITAGGNLSVDTNTFVVNSTNNRVGIGTNNPEREVHIADGVIRVDRSVDSAGLIANRTGIKAFFIGTTADRFVVNDMGTDLTGPGTNRLTIDNSGNVGIGIASPSEKLHVSSGAILAGTLSSTNGSLILAGNYSGANNYLNIFGSHYSSGGTVIGYAVKPKSGAAGYVSSTGINIQRAALNLDGTGLHFLTAPVQTVGYDSDITMSERLTVLNNGNVGIGTTSPTGLLHVYNSSSPSSLPNLLVNSNNSHFIGLFSSLDTGYYNSLTQTGDTGIIFSNGAINTGNLVIAPWASSAAGIRMTRAGDVGIGTANPSGKLDVTVNGALAWAGIFNYNSGSPSGQYGIWTHGSTYALYADGPAYATAFYYSSDASLKKNIKIIPDALDKVLELKGVEFDWKKDGSSSIGLIAQDVEKVFPELVGTDKNTGLKSVEYGNLVAPLIEAIKEQQKQIDDLKKQLDNLK